MSNQKKEKVIHVENLVIHAKNVEIIREHHRERENHERNPWDFFWGRSREQHRVEDIEHDEK